MQSSSSSSRQPRADRTTTSCTECRRRKQKCNQTQPCNNCSRRFPPPKCEYIHKNPNGRQQTQGLPNMSVFAAETITKPSHPSPSQGVAPGLASTKTDPRIPTPNPQARDDVDKPPSTAAFRGTPDAHHARPRQGPKDAGEGSGRSDDTSETALDRLHAAGNHRANLWLLADSLAEISGLAIKPTKLNSMLVKTFVQHLARFKGPLDGQPEPDNPFIDMYAPWCFQSPLLAPIALSVAATSLVQLRRMPAQAAAAMKGEAIQTLNAYLRTPGSATDEAISAVSQLILNDWYFGGTQDMQAHLRGLRELVLMRGGFDTEGVHVLVSKTALVTDCLIAISLENASLNVAEFVFHEPLPEKLNPSYNTPFISQSRYPSFASRVSLHLHPSTARILDDIRFLFSAILKLPPEPSQEDTDKVQHTAKWVLDRIENLPDICPGAPRSSAPPPVTILSARAPSSSASPPSLSSSTNSPQSNSSSSSTAPILPQSHDPSHLLLRTQPAVPHHPPDFLYATVRQTALLYARSAAARVPLSSVCPVPHFYLVWSTAWRVPMREWHRILGVFLWVIVAVLPTAGQTPFASLVKSLMHIGVVQVGMDHWEVAVEMLLGAVRVVGWLAGG